MAETVQLSARVERELAEQLDQLVAQTGRTKVWHLSAALRAYLETEATFLAAVEAGRADIAAGRFVDSDAVEADLDAIEREFN